MALKHDNQGFLVGERLEADDITGRLDAIRDEIRELRRDLYETRHGAGPQAPSSGIAESLSSSIPSTSAERAESRTDAEARRDEVVIRIDRPAIAATPPERREAGRFVYRATETPTATQSARTSDNSTQLPAQVMAVPRGRQGGEARSVAQPADVATPGRGRDANGRFASINGASEEDNRTGSLSRSIDGLGDRLTGAIQEVGAGTEEADPAVKAFNEIAQPLQRGFSKIVGDAGDRRQERWYRRFWKMMRDSRREERAESKRQRRILKNIERKPVGGDSGSMLLRGFMLLLAPMLGMLSLLGRIPLAIAGALAPLLGRLLTALGAGALARRIPMLSGRRSGGHGQVPGSGSSTGRFGRVGGALKQGAKRIPVLGALIGLGFMANDIAASEGSDASRAEKDTMTGRAIGGGLGGIGGMAGGAAAGAAMGSVVPVIGTAIGGVIGAVAGGYFGGTAGEVVGEKVGGWVTELRDSDLVTTITDKWAFTTTFMSNLWDQTGRGIADKWDSVSTSVKEKWERAADSITDRWDAISGEMKQQWMDAVDLASKGWETFTDAMGGVNDWIAEKTGIDVAEWAGQAVEGVSDAVGSAWDGAKTAAREAGERREERRNLDERWQGARDDLVAASIHAGVDPGLVARIAAFESGFDANAAPISNDSSQNTVRQHDGRMAISSAHGYGQFIDATWTDVINRHGARYGIEGAGSLTAEQAADLRNSPAIQAAMLAEFTRENVEKGRRLGGRDDAANAYAFHNLGDGDATRLLKGMKEGLTVREALSQGLGESGQARVKQVIANNPGLYKDGNIPASEAYAAMTMHMQAENKYAAEAQQQAVIMVSQGEPRAPVSLSIPEAQQQAITMLAQDEPKAPVSLSASNTTPIVSTAYLAPMGLVPMLQTPSVPPTGVSPPPATRIAAPSMPSIAEPPTISAPLSSPTAREGDRNVGARSYDVPRDVSDRRIAHIVTGAYSGMA